MVPDSLSARPSGPNGPWLPLWASSPPNKLQKWNPAELCGRQIFIRKKLQILVQEANLRGDTHTLQTSWDMWWYSQESCKTGQMILQSRPGIVILEFLYCKGLNGRREQSRIPVTGRVPISCSEHFQTIFCFCNSDWAPFKSRGLS